MEHDEPVRGAAPEPVSDGPRPAERLRARAAATDRASRFQVRLAEVQRRRARRRQLRRVIRVAWAVAGAAVGALSPILVAAVLQAADPGGWTLLVGAVIGAAVGAVGPVLRGWLARRRGARAWDAYTERYVLLGDPSAEVRDADRAAPRAGAPPRPGERR